MRLEQLMSRNPVIVDPDEKVVEAARTMRTRHTSSALVAQDGRLVGILTERDFAHKVVAEGVSPDGVLVGQLMTPDPITASPDRTVSEAMSLMTVKGIRHLPVCEEGRPVGVVSIRDLATATGSGRVHDLLSGLDDPTRARLAEILLWCAERVGLRREEIPFLLGEE